MKASGANALCCIGDLISVLKRETYKHRSLANKARRRAEDARRRRGDDESCASYCDRLAVTYDAAARAFEAELDVAVRQAIEPAARAIAAYHADQEAKP
jgi:hypothetical protein